MPNITTSIGQYCAVHRLIHKEEYLECDFCNEHKSFINLKYRYYNYGFFRRSYLACDDCHFNLFGPFKLIQVDTMQRAYETIMQVIKDKTGNEDGNAAVDYYEAARIAYTNGQYMKKYLDSKINDISEINKCFRPIWEFTYKIVSGEEKRVRLVNRDPDNLLVSWIPGEEIYCEELKVSNMVVKTSS
jgi:hypothetical protein